MPGTRTPRKYTKRKINPALSPDAGEVELRFEKSADPGHKQRLDTRLYDFLVDYNAGLMWIDRKYTLEDPNRHERLEAHKKNGVKRLMEICGVKANG